MRTWIDWTVASIAFRLGRSAGAGSGASAGRRPRCAARPPWLRAAALVALSALASMAAGCGTTKWSDTPRTATEQLLVTDAMDRAISSVDLRALAGKEIYLDFSPVMKTVDADYLVSSLRQHMLASGCILKERREEAEYVLELRAGAVGTDRRDLLVGVPATKVPDIGPAAGMPTSIPEIGLIKKTEQRAVAKIAMFAYNRQTGRPVWQSGIIPVESRAKDVWFLGAGPFQQGTIYKGPHFAGEKIELPVVAPSSREDQRKRLPVAREEYFGDARAAPPEAPSAEPAPTPPNGPAGSSAPNVGAAGSPGAAGKSGVVPAVHQVPVEAAKTPAHDPKKDASAAAKPSSSAPVIVSPSARGVPPGANLNASSPSGVTVPPALATASVPSGAAPLNSAATSASAASAKSQYPPPTPPSESVPPLIIPMERLLIEPLRNGGS